MADNALAVADDPLAKGRDDPLEASMIEQFKTGQQEQAGARQALQSKIDPQIQGLKKDIAGIKDVGSRPPVDRPTPEPPNPQVAMQEAGTWIAAATVMGALAGALTRRGTTNSIAAFTGALEGFKEGNQQKFQQNFQYWEAQQKKISADNKAQWDKYQAILDSKKIDFQMKMNMLSLETKQGQDDIADKALATKDLITFEGLIAQRRRSQEQMDLSSARIGETIRHNRAMEGAGNEQINETRAAAIAQYRLPPIVNPRNPQDRAVMARAMELNPDYKATKYTGEQSYQRTTGAMAGRIETATDELEQVVPLASQASRAFPRGKFVPINAIKQLIAKGTSNEQYNDFLLANNAVAKAYGRAMNPQGVPRVTEMMEAKAEGILSIQTSPQAYEVQLKRLMMEAAASKRAVGQAREGVTPQSGGGAPGGGAQLPPGWSIEEVK